MSDVLVGDVPVGADSWCRFVETLPQTVRDYLLFAAAENLSHNTRYSRGDLLRRVARDVGDLLGLGADQIAGWLARNPNWSSATKFNYYGHLNAYYSWAYDTGRISAHPMAKMRRPKVRVTPPKEPAPQDLVEDLIANAPQPWNVAVLLAAYAGLRCMEVAGLDRADVTEDSIKVAGKGGRVDLLPCHPTVWAAIRDLPPGPVVRRRDGTALTSYQVSHGFRYYMSRYRPEADMVSFHRIRHAYANKLRRGGVDVRVLQTLMRHTSLDTTQRYMFVGEDERRRAIFGL